MTHYSARSKKLELLGNFQGTELFIIMEENHRFSSEEPHTSQREMMASKREEENALLSHNIKRMRICWNSILTEEKEKDGLQLISNEQPYTEWLTLGIGPHKEDGEGSDKDPHDKGKAIAAEDKADSGSRDVYNNGLTLKVGLSNNDGSSKHMYAMNAYRGETSSNREHASIGLCREDGSYQRVEHASISLCREDGSYKRVEGKDESIFLHPIPENILMTILCKLPLHTLFRMQIVTSSWQSIISTSSYFHTVWERTNVQSWLVMELCDETSGCSNGLALYDLSRKLRYMKMFGEEWSCSNSQWCLRAGDGGLLVYSCRRNGCIRVLNPLTMQSHCLKDDKVTTKCNISSFLKKYHDDVAVHLKCDPMEKTYRVIVIIGNHYLLSNKVFVVSIYTSAEQRWAIRDVRLEGRVSMHMTMSSFTSVLMQNQNIYWFSRNGTQVGCYDLNGDGNIRFLNLGGLERVHKTFGVVMYKGKMIMACKGEQMELQPCTHPSIIYELDELERKWKPKNEAFRSPEDLFSGMICVAGDYICVIPETDGHVSHLTCIDLETGETKVWPEVYPSMPTVRKCLSTPLSFCGCS